MTQFRPSSFQILPTIIKNLIIINVLVWIAEITIGKNTSFFVDNLALHTWQSQLFKPWQFITYMFLHQDFYGDGTIAIAHIGFNMFGLWMFGSVLENLWGPKRFLTFYIICGLGAALAHMIVLFFENQAMIDMFNHITSIPDAQNFITKYGQGFEGNVSSQQVIEANLNVPTVGASGAVFGCLAAFGYLFPNTYIYLYFAIPVKAKWVVIFYIAAELFSTFQASAGDTVAHLAHLGGALAGFLMVYYWNKNNRKTFY